MREELYLLGLGSKPLRRLTKAHIYSLSDFLSHPALAQVLSLPEADISALLCLARQFVSSPPCLVQYREARVATGVRELDMLLDGGVMRGGMYEITGAPGNDALSLAMTAARALMATGERTLLVDTEGNFDKDMLPESLAPHFLYLSLTTHTQLARLLSSFEQLLPAPPLLLLLDGVATLLRALPSADSSFDRLHKTVDTSLRLQAIANRTGCVVLLTSRYTATGAGDLVPVLGESWSQGLVARLLAERAPEGLVLRVQKSVGLEVSGPVVVYSV